MTEFQDKWYIVRQQNYGCNSLIFFFSEISSLQVTASHYSGVLFPTNFIFKWTAATDDAFEICMLKGCPRKNKTSRKSFLSYLDNALTDFA